MTHAELKRARHPQLGTEVVVEAAVRYLRFRRRVSIDHLELPLHAYGRWVPRTPVHPAHLILSVLDPASRRWRVIQEVDLPYDPRTAGEGLSQEMTVEAMDEHFKRVLAGPPHRIELGGLDTDHLRVECDREHAVWPNHGECNGSPFCVPFGTLHPLRAFGQTLAGPPPQPVYRPVLAVGQVSPAPPRGMRLIDRPEMLLYAGKKLSVGFSLRRPMLMHLGWDALGRGGSSFNRLKVSRQRDPNSYTMAGFNGPVLRTLDADVGPCHWTGEVSVSGNQVFYRRVRSLEELELDLVFTVEPDCLRIEATQTTAAEMPVLESEAWRFGWDLRAGMTACATLPTLQSGRNGDVRLPALWAGCGMGGFSGILLEGTPDEARLQIESYRGLAAVTGGLVLAPRPEAGCCLALPAGVRRAVVEWRVTPLEMSRVRGSAQPAEGLRRHFASVLSLFRAEHRGFSNNAASVNVHSSQNVPAELVPYIRRTRNAPDPIALARYTVERGLLDGGGYGYWRNLYLDCDPILLSAAGRLHQARPDRRWLRRIEPGLSAALARLRAQMGGSELLVCRALSGDSGSYRWSANACDIVGFGHLDAYVNAWGYRAFRNAEALLGDLGKVAEAKACRGHAERLRAAYAPALLNPETGWVGGWRSRDGQLHDYAFTWINGPAIAFGLLEPEAARRAMTNLEALRDRVGAGAARIGLPANLLPIRREDHLLPAMGYDLEPTFECYTDGSIMGFAGGYYLRALSLHGPEGRARRMADELEEGYAWGLHTGGFDSGYEFRTWEGIPSGYEGTLIFSFASLYSIAVEKGLIRPPEPEWWPGAGN